MGASGFSGVFGNMANISAYRAPPAKRSDDNRTWFLLHSFVAFWVTRSWCVCLAVTLITGQPEMQGDYVIGGGELACSINYGGWRSQSM
jgi:hypothetical protein